MAVLSWFFGLHVTCFVCHVLPVISGKNFFACLGYVVVISVSVSMVGMFAFFAASASRLSSVTRATLCLSAAVR